MSKKTLKNNYISGLPETIAKFVSFAITTTCFIVFAAGVGDRKISLGTLDVLTYLSLFWFLYESLSFVAYLMFAYFNSTATDTVTTTTTEEDITLDAK